MTPRLTGFVDELVKLSETPRPYESAAQAQQRLRAESKPVTPAVTGSPAQERSTELAKINRSLRNTRSMIQRMQSKTGTPPANTYRRRVERQQKYLGKLRAGLAGSETAGRAAGAAVGALPGMGVAGPVAGRVAGGMAAKNFYDKLLSKRHMTEPKPAVVRMPGAAANMKRWANIGQRF